MTNRILNFEEWLELNGAELECQAAESGADREADFSPNEFIEAAYDEYVEKEFEAFIKA